MTKVVSIRLKKAEYEDLKRFAERYAGDISPNDLAKNTLIVMLENYKEMEKNSD